MAHTADALSRAMHAYCLLVRMSRMAIEESDAGINDTAKEDLKKVLKVR